MINAFCRSHFSYNEKRNLFFSQHPRTCPHCHLPKIKRRLNLNNFTRVHRALICTCALQGEQAAGHGAVGPGAGGAGAVGPGAGGAGHGGHGGAAPNFVTMAQFTIFSNMVTNSLNQLTANINNLTATVNNLTATVNNLTANVNNLSNDVNQLRNNYNNIDNKITRINNHLGLH